MFQYDYPDRGSIDQSDSGQKPNSISPSFKRELRYTDYYTMPQGQYDQQHLLRMGFKFRDIPEATVPLDSSPQFRPQTTREQTDNPWSQGGPLGPKPKFRPLGNAELKKSENASGRGSLPVQVPAAPYGVTGYAAELPDYTSAVPVFRPIP